MLTDIRTNGTREGPTDLRPSAAAMNPSAAPANPHARVHPRSHPSAHSYAESRSGWRWWARVILFVSVVTGVVGPGGDSWSFLRVHRAPPEMLARESTSFEEGVSDLSAASTAASSVGWNPALLDPNQDRYLPDYSVAGYWWGDVAPPRPRVDLHVTDFGAVPDDGLDDTEAFRRALAAPGGDDYTVIRILPGRFLVSDVLFLERGRTILRGAGSGEGGTLLHVDRPLEQMRSMSPESEHRRRLSRLDAYISQNSLSEWGHPYSAFSWKGGVVWIEPPPQGDEVACLPSGAEQKAAGRRPIRLVGGRRGESVVRPVVDTGFFEVFPDTATALDRRAPPYGVYLLQWFNRDGPDGSFLRHVLGPHDLVPGKRLYEAPDRALVSQPVTVVEFRDGTIVLREPLLHDIKPEWTPVLVPVRYLDEVGVEGLDIEFSPSDPARHHLEPGFNGIYVRCAAHSWVRDVHVRNSDSAFIVERSRQVTLRDVTTSGRRGHHSVHIEESYGIAVLSVDFQAPARHHPSFSTRTALSVVSGGRVHQARLDQHGGLNEQNLFDDLVLTGPGPRISCGGSSYWKPSAGRFTTFWNVRIDNGPAPDWFGSCPDAPEARIVGLRSNASFLTFRYGPEPYVEGLNRSGIAVPSLYAYQRERGRW